MRSRMPSGLLGHLTRNRLRHTQGVTSAKTLHATRYAVYVATVAEFGEDDNDRAPQSADDSLPRYCLVERDPHDNKWYDFAETPELLFKAMESDDSDYLPHALVDLDTGEARFVRVHYDVVGSPVVATLGMQPTKT
jgi:hypothetical protein